MQIVASLRILSLLLVFFSLSHIPPIIVAWWYQEPVISVFAISFLVTFAMGLFVWCNTKHAKHELRVRDGFLIVVLVWGVLSLLAAVPFVLAKELPISLVDAIFEATSGLTTTGATVLTGLELLPKSILYYRQQLHFLGGMGILVLAVAILPLLGVGGLQLFRAETSGLVKDNKLTPRVTQTAKALWVIYAGFTVVCIIAYWLGGMSLFDAVAFAFSTVSTGGFTPYDASFSHYPQISLKLIAVCFMLLGALNFSLHFLCFRRGKFLSYFRDAEVKMFFAAQFIVVALCVSIIFAQTTIADPLRSFVEILFQSVAIGTTTGFIGSEFHTWPLFLPILVMLAGLVGGCSGSTTGGIKTIRMLLILKQGWREMNRLAHTSGYFLLKINQNIVSPRISDAVWGFVGMYFMVFMVLLLVLMGFGLDFTSAFGAAVGTLANVGPGLGQVAAHYGDVSDGAKWVLSVAMLIGRLEVFSVLILLTPMFWRR